VREQEVGSEHPRLLVRALCELGAAQAAREAEVVPDPGAPPRLPADRARLDDEGLEPFGRRIHGRREPGRSRPHHDHVELGLLELRRHAVSVAGELRVRRVVENRSVQDDDDRVARARSPGLVEEAPPLGRAVREERVRDAAPGEEIADLVRAGRGRVADDGDLTPCRGIAPTPLEQQLRDEPVQVFVGRRPRLEDVVVDPASCHGLANRLRRLLVRPLTPRDQKPALRAGVELADPLEQVRARLVGEHERDVHAVSAQRLEPRDPGSWRRLTQDLVVAVVAASQLLPGSGERVHVGVDEEDGRRGRHGAHDRRAHSGRSTGDLDGAGSCP
jgi:hypothetical protein